MQDTQVLFFYAGHFIYCVCLYCTCYLEGPYAKSFLTFNSDVGSVCMPTLLTTNFQVHLEAVQSHKIDSHSLNGNVIGEV